jgi:hypothetical protein
MIQTLLDLALRRWKLVAAIAAMAGVVVAVLWLRQWDAARLQAEYDRGHKVATDLCDAENLAAKLAELERQLVARDRVIAEGKARIVLLDKQATDLKGRADALIRDFKHEDAQPGSTSCIPDPARAGRVRDVWGGPR